MLFTRKKIIFIIIFLLSLQGGLYLLWQTKEVNPVSDSFEVKMIRRGESRIDKNKTTSADFVLGGILPHHLAVKNKIEEYLKQLSVIPYKRIILLCPDHLSRSPENITTSDRTWQTEFGELGLDREFIQNISSKTQIINRPFFEEASINDLAPLIKKYFPESSFVPLLIKNSATEREINGTVKAIIDNKGYVATLFLSSVDFSHYLPAAVAEFHDQKTRNDINNFDIENLWRDEVDSPAALVLLAKYLESVGAQRSELIFSTNTGFLSNSPDAESTSHNFYKFYVGQIDLKESASFLFFGDLMLDRYVADKYSQNINALFQKIQMTEGRFFRGVDLIGVNLEGAVTDDGKHYSPELVNDFAFLPKSINIFKEKNFNFFNIANNHLTDQGQSGAEETRENLNLMGFLYSGCADSVIDSCSAASTNINGIQVALVGLSMVYKNLDMEKVNELLDNVGAANDFVVVNVHWGQEYEHKVSQKQRDFGHFLIDNGADLVIGHHPHVIQGVERYQDKLIFYSLGNFIFDQYFSRDTQEGLAVGIFKNEDGMSANLFPFQSKASIPTLSRGRTKEEQLQKIAEWSFGDEEFKSEIEKGKIGSKK